MQKKFTCCLIGNGTLLVQCAQQLRNAGHEIVALISSDKEVLNWAESNSIPICSDKIATYKSFIKMFEFEYLFSIVHLNVIPSDILKLPQQMAINYHDGPLPRYAGINAPSWAIINGETVHGISWHQMLPVVDEGDLLYQELIDLDDEETAFTLNLKCYQAAIDGFSHIIRQIENDSFEFKKQDLDHRTYFAKYQRPENQSCINWNSTAETIGRFINATNFGGYKNNFTSAKIAVAGHYFIIEAFTISNRRSIRSPGTVLLIDESGIHIATKDFDLVLTGISALDGTSCSIADIKPYFPTGLQLNSDQKLSQQDYLISVKSESYWEEQFSAVRQIPSGSVERLGNAKMSKWACNPELIQAIATAPSLPAILFSALITRLYKQESYTLGIHIDNKENYYLKSLPISWHYDEKITVVRHQQQIQEKFEILEQHQLCPVDLFYRYPHIASLNILPQQNAYPYQFKLIDDNEDIGDLKIGEKAILLCLNRKTSEWLLFCGAKSDHEQVRTIYEKLNEFSLQFIKENKNASLVKLDILGDRDRQVLHALNDTLRGYPSKSTCELFYLQALKTPEALAVISSGIQLSYAQLSEEMNNLASYLIQKGIQPGDRVGVLLERSVDLLIALLGIMRAGATYIPLDPIYPDDRLQHMIDDSGLKAILTHSSIENGLQDGQFYRVYLDQTTQERKVFNGKLNAVFPALDDSAYIIYTSGSTGKPKGVEVSHRGLTNFLMSMAQEPGIIHSDRLLSVTTVCFDIAGLELYLPLLVGASTEIASVEMTKDGFALLEKIERGDITVLQATPTTWEMLLAAGWDKKLPLKALCGGEPLRKELATQLIKFTDQLWNMYGPTETTIWSSVKLISDPDTITVGKPIANTTMFVLDEQLNPVALGEKGELYIGGDSLAKGYWQRTELSAERFIEHPLAKGVEKRIYKTGDAAKYNNDGEIICLGRIDNQVKINGYRIELGEIEAAIETIKGVEKAVLVVYDNNHHKELHSFVLYKERAATLSHENFINALSADLPSYMLPTAFYQVDAFPLTLNGKVDRNKILEKLKEDLNETPEIKPNIKEIDTNSKKEQQYSTQENAAQLEALLVRDLKVLIKELLAIDTVETTLPFGNYGFNSLRFTQLSAALKSRYGIKVSPATYYGHDNVNNLALYLSTSTHAPILFQLYQLELAVITTDKDAWKEIGKKPVDSINYDEGRKRLVAVVGMSLQMPQAANSEEFWNNLVIKRDCISEIPKSRWDWRTSIYGEGENNPYKWGGFIPHARSFDAQFFNISPREAALMDPQQRLFLQAAHHAIEDAGYDPASIGGTTTGVFVGVVTSDYWDLLQREEVAPDGYTISGNINCVIANRVSYHFNLKGASAVIDTACSSSLVALHRAVKAIQSGECEAALVGGVNIIASPYIHHSFSKNGMLSKDGRCKSFDEKANGYVRSEGVVCFYLKPLIEAEKNGDSIYGVILGSSENHGGRTNSLSAPSGEAQAELITKAVRDARIDVNTINYIEAHGSGTPLGDPIEIDGIKRALNQLQPSAILDQPACAIASVKSNIGHLEAAAGLAGAAKVLLALKHKLLPGMPLFQEQNQDIDLEDTHLYFAKESRTWPSIHDKSGVALPRRAGVSSFGFGGVNAHVIIEEYDNKIAERPAIEKNALLLSALNEERLIEYIKSVIKFLHQNSKLDWDRICYTFQVGRQALPYRVAIQANSISECIDKLENFQFDTYQSIGGVLYGNNKQAKNSYKELFSDGEAEDLMHALVEKKSIRSLAKLWVLGARVKWDAVYENNGIKRLALPGYPFALTEHWLPQKSSATTRSKAVLHPLIDSKIETPNGYKFIKRLKPNEALIDDHVVNNKIIFPAVGYLELARAAGDLAKPQQKVIKLKGNVWFHALDVNFQQQSLEIEIAEHNGQHEYKISSQQQQSRIMHAQGFIAHGVPVINRETLPFEEIKGRCNSQLDHSSVYDLFRELKFEYKDGYKPIRHISFNKHEAIADVELPEKFNSDLKDFVLHPSLLEGGIQTVIGILANPEQDSNTPYLPFSLKELEIHAPLTRHCKVHIKMISDATAAKRGIRSFDIVIADGNGNVLVNIRNYTLKTLTDSASSAGKDGAMLLTQGKWNKIHNTTASGINAHYIIFESVKGDISRDVKLTNPNNYSVISVIPGASFISGENDSYGINPNSQEDYQLLLAHIINAHKGFYKIIYAWSCGTVGQDILSHEASVNNFILLTTNLLKQSPTVSANIIYLFNTDENGSYLHSGIAGFAKSLHQETSKIKISVMGVDDSFKGNYQNITAAPEKNVAIELNYKNNEYYEKVFSNEKVVINPEANVYKDDHVYLITGGAGAIGINIARHIGNRCKGKIILCGRSVEVERLHQLLDGVNFSYVKTDLTKITDVELLVAEITRSYGRLDGIIHCAGSLSDNLLINKSLTEFNQVIAPKVKGCYQLDEATKHFELKFFVLFSSVTAVMGNMGQTDYGYANSVLDAFSEYRNILTNQGARSGKAISLSWPLWLDGGMSASEQAIQHFSQTTGIVPLQTNQALEILDFAIERLDGVAMIASGDVEKIGGAVSKRAQYQLSLSSGHKTEVESSTVDSQKSIEQFLQRDLFNLAANIIGGVYSDFDLYTNLSTYGFDSISNTELANSINNKFQLEITPIIFFEYQTFAEVITHLLNTYKSSFVDCYSEKIALKDSSKNLPNTLYAGNNTLQPLQVKNFLLEDIQKLAANIVKVAVTQIDASEDISQFGFDSISNTDLANSINQKYGIDITPVLFFEYRNLKEIGDNIYDEHKNVIEDFYIKNIEDDSFDDGLVNQSAQTIEANDSVSFASPLMENEEGIFSQARPEHSKLVSTSEMDVAIIGMEGLLPGSTSLADFWQLLLAGVDLISEIPHERWSWQDYFGDAKTEPGKTIAKWGSFIQDIDKFDANFFNISDEDARLMDPQQRLFIQLVWLTIENAGYKPSDLNGSNTGLYVGLSNRDYFDYLQKRQITPSPEFSFGNNHAFLVNRISYLFNFNGPSEPVDTLCSSSLVAIHRAVNDLRAGLCQQAIVGGISLLISPLLSSVFEQAGMLSPEGRCRTFNADANGFVRGEGAGALMLKPLHLAQEHGDNIIAVIKGSAVNHGGRANSLTAPNLNAQADLLIAAWSSSNIDPYTISYIETHGTGTKLGDAIEVNAIKKAFKTLGNSQTITASPDCRLGSVKTNIGHLESASGIASILKVLLALKAKKLPKILHLNQVNPYIDLKNTPFQLVGSNQDWPALLNNIGVPLPRRAGINAFGAGGVNAHIVLEEYVDAPLHDFSNIVSPVLIVLSAKRHEDLLASAGRMAAYLIEHADTNLERLAATLQIGREPFAHRLAFVTSDIYTASNNLKSFSIGQDTSHIKYANTSATHPKESMAIAADHAVHDKDLIQIENYWLAGINPDWTKLYPNGLPKRLPLPGYTFNKARHWVDIEESKPRALHSIASTNSSREKYRHAASSLYHQEFIQGEVYLRDHKVFDDEVLLGVTYASMAIQAAQIQGNSFNRLQRLLFINPLALYSGERATVGIELSRKLNEMEFSAYYQVEGRAERKTAATGILGNIHVEETYIDLEKMNGQFRKVIQQNSLYAILRKQGVDYDNSLLTVQQLLSGDDSALGMVEFGPLLQDSTPDYLVHPIWLDAAVVCAKAAFLENTASTYIPFSFNDIVIHRKPKNSSFCHIQLTKFNEQIFMCDAQICDADGLLCIDIKGMVCKRIRLEEDVSFTSRKIEPTNIES